MPSYPWLLERRIDPDDVQASVRALKRVGTPYTDGDVESVPASVQAQGQEIIQRLIGAGIVAEPDREIIALIAYLQRLGRDGTRAVEAGLTARVEPR
jgi:cytochrome c oxidase cbb3-type subunit I/II